MKVIRLLIISSFLLIKIVIANSSPDSNTELNHGPYNVGYFVKHYHDFSRTFVDHANFINSDSLIISYRPIQMSIWYPAEKSILDTFTSLEQLFLSFATEINFTTPNEERNRAALKYFQDYCIDHVGSDYTEKLWEEILNKKSISLSNAKPLNNKYPLVIYIPGNPGNSFENHLMCEYIASYGYVVASIPSIGDQQKDMQIDLIGIEAQARDIEFVMSMMNELPNVDASHTGVIGFSWGGIVNVQAAMRNRFIKALVTLDGSITIGEDSDIIKKSPYYQFRKFETPTLVIVGKQADWYEFDLSFYNSLKYSPAYLIKANKLPHSQFRSLANELNVNVRTDLESMFIKNVKRSYVGVCSFILNFFNGYLKENAKSIDNIRLNYDNEILKDELFSLEWKNGMERPPMDQEFFNIIKEDGIYIALDIYKTIKKNDPDVKIFHELSMNQVGYMLLNDRKIEEAIEVFKLNVIEYPKSSNSYDSLGEAYMIDGNKELAIKNYAESLELDPENANAIKMLKRLK